MAVKREFDSVLHYLEFGRTSPSPYAISPARWKRTRPQIVPCSSVVAFQSRPTRHLPTEPATKLEVRSFRGDQRGERENRSDRVDLGRDSPFCFPPSKEQQMQTARMKYKILEAFIQNHHVIAESSTIAIDAGARERGNADERRARSVTGHQA